jgi:2-polyprenyl-3-methyl-5-hydroxy-6-metoxy-1,4-benzoquinol methylase
MGGNTAKKIDDGLSTLQELQEALAHAKVTPLELKRCQDEIRLITRRLVTGEYIQSCFQPRNLLSIPDRTDEIFKDLRFFWSVGAVWENLLDKLGVRPTAQILDIGCGFFPKIELGLYYHGFEGTVTLCDPNQEALEHAVQFLKFFRVSFEAQHYTSTLWTLKGKQYDAIVANHFLDDVILVEFAKREGLEVTKLYRTESEYQKAWTAIKATKGFCDELVVKLAGKLNELLKSQGSILLLDYPSFSHKAMGIKALLSVVNKFQANLRDLLSQTGLRERQLLQGASIRRERLIIRDPYIVAFKRDYEGEE